MQKQIKPQVDASMKAAFELANMSFTQLERVTELALEQARVNAELAQEQLATALEIKDPAAALELLKSQLEASAKSLAGFAATAFELSQEFHAEGTAFAEGHLDHAHAAANKALTDNLKKAPEGSEAAVTAVKAALDAAGLQAGMAEVTYRPEITIELNDDDRLKMQKIIDALEELDDVQEVFHNAAL
jgi:hypothetical protein